LSRRNLVDHFNAPKNFSEHRVAPIEAAIVRETDKKLRPVVVEIPRAVTFPGHFGHGNSPALVRSIARLRIQEEPRPSGSVGISIRGLAQRIAALNDKARDDPMKRRAIVEPHLGEIDEIFYMSRGIIGVEANLDLSEPRDDRRAGILFLKLHHDGPEFSREGFPAARACRIGSARPDD